ncbi:hypothetical protein DOY81_008109 [Sarcophaga bullata]|nr:hypothetical protein DOY81_008109 [Sarcophaga bullata]
MLQRHKPTQIRTFEDSVRIPDVKPWNLSGNFLIKFHNTTFNLNSIDYLAMEVHDWKPLPHILQLTSKKTDIEEVLSLQMIKEVQLNNVQELSSL